MREKDLKWMRYCIMGAQVFSTCRKRQYFAVVLDDNDHVLGTGYNGGPSGMRHCVDGGCPRAIENSPNGSVYDNCISIHAEANALLHSDYTARHAGSKLYVNGPPCWDCGKLIANSGIKQVFYMIDPNYADWPRVEGFMSKAGVDLHYVPKDLL